MRRSTVALAVAVAALWTLSAAFSLTIALDFMGTAPAWHHTRAHVALGLTVVVAAAAAWQDRRHMWVVANAAAGLHNALRPDLGWDMLAGLAFTLPVCAAGLIVHTVMRKRKQPPA